jgi:hypothetical protein
LDELLLLHAAAAAMRVVVRSERAIVARFTAETLRATRVLFNPETDSAERCV